jgi:amino acid permease
MTIAKDHLIFIWIFICISFTGDLFALNYYSLGPVVSVAGAGAATSLIIWSFAGWIHDCWN